MSERLTHRGPEIKATNVDTLIPQQRPEKDAAQTSQEARKHAKEQESHARATIEQVAVSGREMAPKHNEHHSGAAHRPATITRELKAMALTRTLKRAQRRLPAPERVLSKLMHQPAVNRASEVGGKTIARPSGILGGGLLAFVGSSILYIASKRYGFAYNFSALLFLFAGGFLLGMIIELSLYSRRLKK